MSTIERRYAIVESLPEMNDMQTQQVLEYIQSVVKEEREKEAYENFKRQAMNEIRAALDAE